MTPTLRPAVLIEELRQDLLLRRVGNGLAQLQSAGDLLLDFDPQEPCSPELVMYVAQWVDIGYRDVSVVRAMLDRFPQAERRNLPLADYLHLRMAAGMVALAEEEEDVAARHFDVVLFLHEEISRPEVVAMAHFWKARCHRMKGEYEESLKQILAARSLADREGHRIVSAMMGVLESWVHFQKGRNSQARRLLEEAEAVLRETDDFVTLGNIQSAYGRLLRREGKYQAAFDCFRNAIECYERREPQGHRMARTLVNMAYVERMLSLQAKRQIDEDSPRLKRQNRRLTLYRELFERLRRDALEHLQQASHIYMRRREHHGAGTAKVNCGFLHLDSGDLDLAAHEGEEAYALGRQKHDHILMARARLLQCAIENAALEEELEASDPAAHARAAMDYATEAIECARHTENSRLLARTYIWQGLTCLNDIFYDANGARAAAEKAAALIEPNPHDPLWGELEGLRSRVRQAGSVNETLQAWSQGATGDKSFQQITEEFAEIVIPKVWEQEDHKVARVAKRLSISPKKVRRILIQAGLMTREEEGEE